MILMPIQISKKRNPLGVHRLQLIHKKIRQVTPQGEPFAVERRRIKPPVGGNRLSRGHITVGTAENLFVDLGVSSRGRGTKKQAARARLRKNRSIKRQQKRR